ncbi:hypothetical protein [Leptospira stimsonii]|uniref:Uncharacterized protein n=1 Tax=Leptospira stimsonii TaxID=2202203 RepID=A0A8B3CSM7_9LEPT|nr:hypothetical protein [Leptospira stimsonii]RHX86501.1 hypothetical protein DLM78_11880 [Leptospira stimsonii]
MKFSEILQKANVSWKNSTSTKTLSLEEQARERSKNEGLDSSRPFAENLLTEQQLLYISEYYLALR